MESLISALEKCLCDAGLARVGAKLLCAVSGGADSVALLHAASALKTRAGFTIVAVHVEHGLRGESSRGDEAFVRGLCGLLGVELMAYHPALDPLLPGVEARARAARRECYKNAIEKTGADAIMLAHHADDQAETVLMRLMRGGGTAGLSGMREISGFEGALLLRPFLSISKSEILAALSRAGLDFRTDETNREPFCERNRIRLEIMPMLSEIAPDVSVKLCQTASRMRRDDECLSDMAHELLKRARVSYYDCLFRDELRAAPRAVAVRALRRWVGERLAGADENRLDYSTSEALIDIATGHENGVINLPLGLRAEASHRCVHILTGEAVRSPDEVGVFGPGEYAFGSVTILAGAAARLPDGARAISLPGAVVKAGLTVRAARPGDRIRPFGLSGHKDINRYYTDRKLDAAFRPHIPVLFSGNTALWIPGVGASEETRLHTGETDVVQLYARGEMPWSGKE